MKTSDLNYKLPPELIAKDPAHPRDSARLLYYSKLEKRLVDSTFRNIDTFLRPGDLIIFNDTKVFPARAFGVKDTGGKVEVLFLSEQSQGVWEVLISGRVKSGQKIWISDRLEGVVRKNRENTLFDVGIPASLVYEELGRIGEMPLPPYMKRRATMRDNEYYQTVFARKIGSAAAPTASLHFTKGLVEKLKRSGVEIGFVELKVGLGTFAPVKTEYLEDHPIHSEFCDVSAELIRMIKVAKKKGGRVIACGTTVCRALETSAVQGLKPISGETSLFIRPGFEFKVVDGLITNFHTPKSSLLGLVFAFVGEKETRLMYQHAIKNEYRFFSYGDGTLIL